MEFLDIIQQNGPSVVILSVFITLYVGWMKNLLKQQESDREERKRERESLYEISLSTTQAIERINNTIDKSNQLMEKNITQIEVLDRKLELMEKENKQSFDSINTEIKGMKEDIKHIKHWK